MQFQRGGGFAAAPLESHFSENNAPMSSESYQKILPGAPGSTFRQDFDNFSKSARGVPGTTSGGFLLFPGVAGIAGTADPNLSTQFGPGLCFRMPRRRPFSGADP